MAVQAQDWLIASVLGIDDDGVCFQSSPQQNTTQVHQGFGDHPNRNQAASYSSSSCCTLLSMEFYQYLASQLEKQRLDLDLFLQIQKDKLSTVLQEVTSQQEAVLLQGFEQKMMNLIWQKDQHISVAKKKTLELQYCMIKADMEAKAWKKKAIENQAIVLDLNNRLNQVKKRDDYYLFSHGVQDEGSFCGSSNSGNKGDKDQEEKEQKKKMACKLCHIQNCCVVFLPCRHLCSCKSCEAFLVFCPVCQSVKKGSIEVFLF